MAYTLEEKVWNEMLLRFTNAMATGQTLSYVNRVFQGERQEEITAFQPCIIMDIGDNIETWEEMPLRKQLKLNITVKGQLDVRTRLDKQIVGDDTQIGILRFEHDIKKVIEGTDIKYDNNVYIIDYETESRSLIDNATREVKINVTIAGKYFDTDDRL